MMKTFFESAKIQTNPKLNNKILPLFLPVKLDQKELIHNVINLQLNHGLNLQIFFLFVHQITENLGQKQSIIFKEFFIDKLNQFDLLLD
jgi:hypothetical protein